MSLDAIDPLNKIEVISEIGFIAEKSNIIRKGM